MTATYCSIAPYFLLIYAGGMAAMVAMYYKRFIRKPKPQQPTLETIIQRTAAPQPPEQEPE